MILSAFSCSQNLPRIETERKKVTASDHIVIHLCMRLLFGKEREKKMAMTTIISICIVNRCFFVVGDGVHEVH